jgi:23S rRNA (cytidine1920-2'-O)/16S rRNA (cytidine1409-2'-O)-methyltransferase
VKRRLDQELALRGLTVSRSQAESLIKLGQVKVGNSIATKPGRLVSESDKIVVEAKEQYVSRAALKLASVAEKLGINFKGSVVLDVGSSTGGFTDYALRHGAVKVIAVDVGTNQLHPSLRSDDRIELHEQTDIRNLKALREPANIVVIDVSFISLREVLPAVAALINSNTIVLAMVKPQFEAAQSGLKHKGVIKNEKMRRNILKEFENWVQELFVVVNKADSEVSGSRGNQERFYVLKKLR